MSSRYRSVTFRIPLETLVALDSHTDGIKYRNRTHIVSVILDQWVSKHAIPEIKRLQVELPHTIEPTPVSKQTENKKSKVGTSKSKKKTTKKTTKKTSAKKQAVKK